MSGPLGSGCCSPLGPSGGGGGGAVSSVFGRIGAVVAALNDYAASLIDNDSGVGGATVADALNTLGAATAALIAGTALPTTLPDRGSENVSVDLWPSQQQQGAINTGGSVTMTVAVPTGRSLDIAVRCQVVDSGTGAVVFFSRLLYTVHNVGGVLSNIIPNQDNGTVAGAGFLFSGAVVGTDVVFTLSNASGTNRTYNMVAGRVLQDNP